MVATAGFLPSPQFIHGKVIDAHTKMPLDGANVFVSQTTYATITDAEGRFTVQVSENNYQLLISYVGYQEVLLGPAMFTDRLARYTIELTQRAATLKNQSYTIPTTFFSNSMRR